MHTKDQLADALMKIGLMDMSLKARGGYYHDFLSPLATPELQLIADLAAAANNVAPPHRKPIYDLRLRVIDGEFDASVEESEAWANSPEGQAAMQALSISGKERKEKP